MKRRLQYNAASMLYHIVDVSEVQGAHSELSGNCTGLRGNCTGLSGDCSGLSGNIDNCELTTEERDAVIDIAQLVVQ